MTDHLRWGILGAATFAKDHMAPAIHLASQNDLVALATSDPAKAKPFQAMTPALRVHSSYDALLEDPEIDAVYIPLPNHLHVDWTLKALEAGKHVLCEKPLAMRADQFDAVIAKRDETGLLAAEAYMIVHHPQWHRARDLVQGGAIGRLIDVGGVFTYDNSDDTGNIRNDPSKGGGGLPDIGVYTYGATRFVSGQEPQEILMADIEWENGVDVVARVSARFESFSGHWVNSMRMHPEQRMWFHGTDGIVVLTTPFNAGVFGQAEVALHRNVHGAGGANVTVERFPLENQYVLQIQAFSNAVHRGEHYPCPLEFSRGTQAMIDMVFDKAGRG